MDDTRIAHIASRPLRTIEDVVAAMQELDLALDRRDGVYWFNFLYLRVTESVRREPATWRDAAWLERLDVVFASLYFDALRAWAAGRSATPHSWRALFDSRRRRDVARIQFALAGMNAHINHDLALALLRTSEERGGMPGIGSAQHHDFERVDTLLERVEAEVKPLLLSPIASEVDVQLGRVDDVIAMWNVRKARETAWINGELLWDLRAVQIASRRFLGNLDRLVGLAGRGLLVPTSI